MSVCDDLSYSDFGNVMHRASAGARVPLAGSFEITFKCNLRCVHCYIDDYSGAGEMSTAEIRRILSEVADEGCLWMLLTGGEILSRSDFDEIYLHAKRCGLLITLYTNGVLFDERIVDLLAEYPPFGIEITLYGLSDDTYLRTTGFPGRFTRVRRSIDLILSRGLRLTLKAVAMEPLSGEIGKMEAFCESIGVPFRYDPIIHARLDGSLAPTRARPSPERVVQYDADDPRRANEWLRFHKQFVEPSKPTTRLLSCGAGVNSFHIDPKGTLLSCEALPLNGYDLRHGTFREGWYGIIGDLRRQEAGAANVCAPCELRGMCDRCPATATLETGSPDGWIPYFCEITHRRAALLEEMSGHHDKAERYRKHAEKVKGGWTPPGAILPRATALGAAAAGCGSCPSSVSGTAGSLRSQTPLIQIELPGHRPVATGRSVDEAA